VLSFKKETEAFQCQQLVSTLKISSSNKDSISEQQSNLFSNIHFQKKKLDFEASQSHLKSFASFFKKILKNISKILNPSSISDIKLKILSFINKTLYQ
jgi:hypothetical protein